MNILSIGGSDPSSGAGIQSDIRASVALGANCFSVITAITSQNSQGFFDAEPVSPKSVRRQLESVFSDFKIDAIVIGMVYDTRTISVIHKILMGKKIPTVVDPVIKSTTGGVLLKKSALGIFAKKIIPLADVVTPNVKEAEAISGIKIKNKSDLLSAAKKIRRMGAKNIIITGYEIEKNKIADFSHDGKKQHLIMGEKIPGTNHGSGCNFAFAVAFNIGAGKDVFDAAKKAKEFTHGAIRHSRHLGKGIKITAPKMDRVMDDLSQAVQKFTRLKNVVSLVPEVQTNFVFAKENPRSLDDVVGVSGRIVKAGGAVVVAGNIEYGGSRHIGTAVLTMQKKFPQMRSAINVKFDEKTVKRLQRAMLKILSYDRSQEPIRSKLKENSTVSWGIHHAIQNQSHPPDAVYHRGDVGKEPMIIIFGKTPKHVLEKLKKII